MLQLKGRPSLGNDDMFVKLFRTHRMRMFKAPKENKTIMKFANTATTGCLRPGIRILIM